MTKRFLATLLLLLPIAIQVLADDPVVFAPARLDNSPLALPQSDLAEKIRREGRINVIVRFSPKRFDALIPARLEAAGKRADRIQERIQRVQAMRQLETDLTAELGKRTRVHRRFSRFPLVAMQVDAEGLARLQSSDLVAQVSEDRLLRPSLAQSIPQIGADIALLDGFDGDGQLVAVLDTGALTSHDYFEDGQDPLQSRVRTDLEACFSNPPAEGDTSLCPDPAGLDVCLDSSGQPITDSLCGPGAASVDVCESQTGGYCNHGTHVAGIAVGTPGVAPAARLIPIQVFFRRGSELLAQTSDLLAALDYVLGLKESGEPVATINMSLGGDPIPSTAVCDAEGFEDEGEPVSPIKPVIDALRSAGTATVVAAGNNGNTTGLSYPGCLSSVISVGASHDDVDLAWAGSNQQSAMTLFAPGRSITSASTASDTATVTYTGTSMATPHVAGAIAALAAAGEGTGYTVSNLAAAMQQTGVVFTNAQGNPPIANAYGVPRLQLDDAIAELLDPAGLPYALVVDSLVGGMGEPGSNVEGVSGLWQNLTTADAYAGDVWRGVSTIEPNTARFEPALPPGIYDVALRWPVLTGNPAAVEVTVSHDLGDTVMLVDQTQDGGQWNPIGTYAFQTTPNPAVTLSDLGAGRLALDAVRFTANNHVVPVGIVTGSFPDLVVGAEARLELRAENGAPPYQWQVSSGSLPDGLTLDPDTGMISGTPSSQGQGQVGIRVIDTIGEADERVFDINVGLATADLIIDNEDAHTTREGVWGFWSPPPGISYGGSFRYSYGAGQTDRFRFLPHLPVAGLWRVYGHWPGQSNHASRAVIAIGHADGETVQEVDQRIQGRQWVDLGTYRFAVVAGGYVELSDPYGGLVIADAVRFEWVGTGLADPLEIVTESLPGAIAGDNYSVTLEASGGTEPYAWSDGGDLPAWLTLSAAGTLTGQAPTAGPVSFTVSVHDSIGAEVSRQFSIEVIEQPADVVIDNEDAQTTREGVWGFWSPPPGVSYGGSFRYSYGAGQTDRFRYLPQFPAAGLWRVYGYWPGHSNHASEAVIAIGHAEGETVLTVDQRTQGRQWVDLGIYRFAADAAGYVEFSDPYGGLVIADAVRFEWTGSGLGDPLTIVTEAIPGAVAGDNYSVTLEASGGIEPYVWSGGGDLPAWLTLGANGVLTGQAPAAGSVSFTVSVRDAVGTEVSRQLGLDVIEPPADVIIDNEDVQTTREGVWGFWSPPPGVSYGGSFRYSYGAGQTDRFRFLPQLPVAGSWRVYGHWPGQSNHASRAVFAIGHADGETVQEVDQRIQGRQWVDLGTYRFVAGVGGYVELSDPYGGLVIADAVRLEWVGNGGSL